MNSAMVSKELGGINECLLIFLPEDFVFKLIITNLFVKMLIFFFSSDFDLALLKQAGTGSNYMPVLPWSLIVCRLTGDLSGTRWACRSLLICSF